MNVTDLLFGRPLATEEEKAERIGPLKGIPVFGLDALSSAAYGPEAALTLLIPLGMAGAAYIWPVTIGIVILLCIVYFSYLQTISAYPQGGGSYTVASENLGHRAGLLAAVVVRHLRRRLRAHRDERLSDRDEPRRANRYPLLVPCTRPVRGNQYRRHAERAPSG